MRIREIELLFVIVSLVPTISTYNRCRYSKELEQEKVVKTFAEKKGIYMEKKVF